MVPVKDLRLGNYMRDRLTGEPLVVLEILLMPNDKSEHVVSFHIVNRDKYPLPKGWQAEPIPLTDEILLQCDFIRSKTAPRFEGDGALWLEKLQANTYTPIHPETWRTMGVNLKYLHQLQNLYFALEGKELTVSL